MASSSQLSSCLLSSSERLYILQGCHDNCRLDGRRRDEFRHYLHHNNPHNSLSSSSAATSVLLPLCNGSARVFNIHHSTDLLASVKAELVHPAPQTPNLGTIELSIDHQPTGQQQHQQQRTFCDQLQSLLSNLFIPYCLDLTSLCLVPGMYVWKLHIDVWIVSSGGGSIVDACSRVIRAALMDTQLPHVELLSPSSGTASSTRLGMAGQDAAENPNKITTVALAGADWIVDSDISRSYRLYDMVQAQAPLVVTVSVLPSPSTANMKHTTGSQVLMLVDATLEEESCAICLVHVAIDAEGAICATTMTQPSSKSTNFSQRTSSSSLSLGMLQEITDLALSHALELHRHHQDKQKQQEQQFQPRQHEFSLFQPYFSIQ